jgi:hypothetical protein
MTYRPRVIVLAFLACASWSTGAEEREYREVPDDPPATSRAVDNLSARSPGARVVEGPYVSVQANIDALGMNIVGDAANEPSIAVSPVNPDNIVIGWRQFDSVTSNFRQGGWAHSEDGGETWTFPGVLEPGVFRSDPVLDSASDGVFVYQSLEENLLADVFRSVNGGESWLDPVFEYGGDKNWMAVDKSGGTGDGHIYGTWQRFSGCCGQRTFTRSIDEGDSFEQPVAVELRPLFGTMAVGPEGELYIAGIEGTVTQDFDQFVIARSDDAQNPAVPPTFRGIRVDLGGSMVFEGAPNPVGLLGQAYVAVDRSSGPTRGNVYMLASVDPPGPDPLDVHLIRSFDHGETWSAPLRVNDDPLDNGAWQWFGAHSVAPNGRVDVIWNDTRGSGQATTSQLFYSYSWDAGETWSPNVAASPSFRSNIGFPNQNKIGDYYTIISNASGADVAYSATFNGEQDVYHVRVFPDCNGNTVSDVDDIAGGDSQDSNGNHIPDECEAPVLAQPRPAVAGQANLFVVTGATPNANVSFLLGFAPGTSPVPGCPDATVTIQNPRNLGSQTADAEGTARLRHGIPPDFAGRTVLFQAVERSTCRVSNRVATNFQ